MKLSNWLSMFGRRRASSIGPLLSMRRSTCHRRAEVLEERLCLSAETVSLVATPQWFDSFASPSDSSNGLAGASTSGFVGPTLAAREFLVRLTPEATTAAGSATGARSLFSASSGLTVTAGLGLPGQLVVSTTERDTVQIVESLRNNPAVAYFEEDFSVGATVFPDEQSASSQFSRQYGLHNTGQTGGVTDADIDAPEAWDITTGSVTTVVAQLDSGVDYTHPDLYLNIWLNQGELPSQFESSLSDADSDGLITFRDLNAAANFSFVSDLNGNGYIDAGDLLDDPRWADGIDTDGNGFEDDLVGWDFFQDDNRPFDEHRHGTHVAGILGAVGDNGFGGTGVNWQTSIMPLRFLDEDNRGDVSSAVEAINYTTMMRTRTENAVNVRVSNNSWGSSGTFSQTLFDAVAGNAAADIVFVAAAGNGDVLGQGVNNDDVSFFPANLDLANVISVAALNDRGELASFSNFGGTTVDIGAPGVGIVSTDVGGDFISRSGTSMATPFVAGVAALVFDQFPTATAAEVRDAILSGAVTSASLDGFIEGSRSLNAFGALTASTFAPVPELVPVATITTDGTLNIDITVTYTDDGSVDTGSFDIRDIEVTRRGFSETLLTPASVTTTSVNIGGQDRDAAVYRFSAPGGTFDATENGTWTVSLREGEIQDNLGLYSAPRELGQFTVSIDAANVIFVNTTLDTVDANPSDGQPTDSAGRVSLRSAIMHANQASAATTIVIPDGVYALTIPGRLEDAAATGDLDLTSSLGITLVGGGGFATTIDAQQLDRVFDIAPGATAIIKGLGIRNGNAEQGGGIENSGTLTLDASLVASNSAETTGGGIFSNGDLTITDSSVESNVVTSRLFASGGGGIAIAGNAGTSAGRTSIGRSSIVSNRSATAGGGVLTDDAELTLTNVTIASNTAERSNGGGLLVRTTGTSKQSTLTSVTITGNAAPSGNGGGLKTTTSTAQLRLTNSIIASNTARTSPAVEGLITSDGNNLFGQPSPTLTTWRTLAAGVADFDQIGTAQVPLDPQLLPLKRSTGVVQARAPISGGRSSNDDLAGTATLALTPGLPIVYSTVELEPNNSRGEAMRLDDRGWSLDFDPNIANSTTIPHVTITGTGDGTFDYFSFTVSNPNSTAVFDIDNGSLAAGEEFNTKLFLFDSSDNLLAENDGGSLDVGSSTKQDARIEHTFVAPGYYTIAVGTFGSSNAGVGRLAGSAPPVGKRYVLNVSVDQHTLAPTAYNPASGDDILYPIAGTATGSDYLFSATEGLLPFQGAQNFAPGNAPHSVAVGDVNGDGFDDIITANYDGSQTVSVLRGNGDGTFQANQNFATGDGPYSVVLGDVNGDGLQDIVTANFNSVTVSVLAGNGNGTFQAAQIFAVGESPQSVVLGDVNGDGFDDIVTANGGSATVSVLRGNGNGTFQAAQNFTTGGSPRSVAVGDVNGDGFADIVSANYLSDNVSVLRGNGNGTFQAAQDFAVGRRPRSAVLGDVNGDGIADIVTANGNSDNVSVLRGIGNGTFQAAQNFAAGDRPDSMVLGDVNGDGLDDIVTANRYSNNVSVLRGNGDGTFQAAQNFAVGESPRSVVLGDVNGDGLDDIITANRDSDDVSVLTNSGPRLVEFPATSNELRSLPIRESPLLFASDNDTAYWLSAAAGTMESGRAGFNLWSYSRLDGVHLLGSFVELSGAGRPVRLVASRSTLVIESERASRVFDIAAGEIVTRTVGDGTFQSPQNFAAGEFPVSVILGDVNGDGIDDIVTANSYSDNVSVLRGNGDGTFQQAQNSAAGDSPQSVVLGDVNGDGIDDIVTANRNSDNVSVLRGNGDGTFQAAQNFAVGDGPRSAVLGDVNGDGINDIVSANGNSDDVSVLRGNGNGTFQAAQSFAVGDGPRSVVLGDVNGDGIDDIVTANFNSDNVSVLRGNGNGTFQAAQNFAAGNDARSARLGDVNGDGIDDIVTANLYSAHVSVLHGNGDGTFQAPQNFATGEFPYSVVLGDVNGDGIDDIVTANRFRRSDGDDTSVSVLRGNGDGTFQSAQNFLAGNGPSSVVLGDVNGDGVDDIVTTNFASDNVSVLQGNPGLSKN
jgi:predicted outer membrane repeat protein